MPPLIPYPILGTVTDSLGSKIVGEPIFLTNTTKSSNPLRIITDSNGRYVADAGNFNTGYSSGDTVSVSVFNSFKDETKTITFTISGSLKKNADIQTEVIKTLPENYTGRTQPIIIVNASQEPYQATNPLPISEKFYHIHFFYTRALAKKSGTQQPEYLGWARPNSDKSDAVWIIQKLIYDGTFVTDILWADGDINEDNIWNNRINLSYS